MNKIKNIRDLRYEKLQLQIKQQAAENRIRENWKDLKDSLHPKTFIKDSITEFISRKKIDESDNQWKRSILNLGLSFAAKKLINVLKNKF